MWLRNPAEFGLVGDVDRIQEHAIMASIRANAIPVLARVGETADDQILHLDADNAAHALVRHFQPYKVIFLTAPAASRANTARSCPRSI